MNERPSIDVGAPGASARREHTRRRGSRKLSLSHKGRKSWAVGARGEEMLAESLVRRCPGVLFLHDRRMPRSRANIDHLAVAPTGVYVIDAKRYRGKIEVAKPIFGTPKLRIAGRDRTKLIEGLHKQVALVRSVVDEVAPDVPVYGCLCFLAPEGLLAESGVPIIRRLKINGYRLFYPRALAKQLNKSGPIDSHRGLALQADLARRLPVA